MMKQKTGIWSLAVGAAMAGATLAGAPLVSAQEAAPASAFDDAVAVAGSSFQLDLFAGGDERGGMYGVAPTVTLPLGDSMGIQLDAIGGKAGNDTGFYGGAAQLFFRDPTTYSLGVAVSGVVIDDNTQYGVSGIAEYYVDNITFEALLSLQSGDIMDDGVIGRVGLSYYAAPSFRVGFGLSYSEEMELGADTEVEFMLAPESGLAFFALGAFDKDGALGLAGLRLYAGSPDERTKQGMYEEEEGGGISLMDRHRHMGRSNSFLSRPSVGGARFIAQVAGALADGVAFGDLPAAPTAEPEPSPTDALSNSAIGDLLTNLISTDGTQAPLGDLLAGILPAGETGTPLDGIPIVGDLAGSIAVLLSPETLRVGDLPTGDNSLAAIPLVGDLLNLLPAEGTYVLLGSLQPEAVGTLLLPGIIDGITDPAVLGDLLGRLGSTLGLPGLPSLAL